MGRAPAIRANLLFGLLILVAGQAGVRRAAAQPPPAAAGGAAIETKVRDLLSRMTLEEKIGQMMQLTNDVYARFQFEGGEGRFVIDEEKLARLARDYHVGSLLNGPAAPAAEWVRYSQKIQEIVLANSRLKIPIIYGIDHMHGASYVSDATIFPHALNVGATFDVELARAMGAVTARESAGLGHHWIFGPLGDVAVNPTWPRTYETYGEDPFLCATMAAAAMKALQECPETAPYRQAACAKHFLGYGGMQYGGWDRTQAAIPDQALQEFFVPPFKAMIDAGVKTIMVNSGEINGVPVHASQKTLTGLLRRQLGFRGVVVTDWEDIIKLATVHRVAADEREATRLAIDAGIDMAMTPTTTAFFDHMKALVAAGAVSTERIDQSVERILRLKFELGLFDHPFPPAGGAGRLRRPENVERAYRAACESLVLLKNDGVLPLDKARTILVAGPNAASKRALCGGWTMRWIPDSDAPFPAAMPTVYDALKAEFGEASVRLVEEGGIAEEGRAANAIVIVAGEMPYSETAGNTNDMNLEAGQAGLIRAAQATGKPVVLVLVAGRPRVVTPLWGRCAAVVWAGLPGFEGGRAIAAVLSGKVCPSGKLNFTYPAQPGVCVPYYHKFVTEKNGRAAQATLAPFGAGLSYTTFAYDGLKLDKNVVRAGGTLTASVRVTNTGARAGKEAVLWYLTDEVGRVSRPVKTLKHFEKRELGPGQSGTFQFEIDPARDLSYPDDDGGRAIEDGFFTLAVGGLKARFEYRK